MAVNYGQVAIVPKGVWNAETQYKVNNLVEYDGSSYVAKVQPPVGTLPTDTSYWQVSAAGTKKATPDSLGTVMPDGTTTEIKEDGKLSAKTAQQNALGVVKGSDDITVGEDGNLSVNTTFEQATEIANIIAGEAIKSVLGKVSKAIATTMSLDENALLKNMISGIDVNDGNKVPSSAYIHTLVERIGMGTELSGFDNLTAGLNSVNNNLGNGVFKALTFSDFSTSDDIKLACQKMFSALPTSGVCYRVRMKPTPSGTTADAYVYCASSNYGFVHIRDHGGTDYYGRVQNGTWTWDSYALKSDLDLKLNNTSFFVGNGGDFGQAIKKAGIVQLNRVGFFICNNPSNSPLENGLIILAHNVGYWNNHPMYIQINGSSISCGTLNCSDYTHITKD